MANNGRAPTTNRLCGDFLMYEGVYGLNAAGRGVKGPTLDACDGLLRELCIMHGFSIVRRFITNVHPVKIYFTCNL